MPTWQKLQFRWFWALLAVCLHAHVATAWGDHIRKLQTAAIETNKAEWGHWGAKANNYTGWNSHSNRLIPVYTFGTKKSGAGVDLEDYSGARSVYRNREALEALYGRLPDETLNDYATYFDQTNVADIQRAAFDAGKKHIFLVVFDGMDWQTTQAAAIVRAGKVGYAEGRGNGLHFQDYTAEGTSQYGYAVTSPIQATANTNVDTQTVGKLLGSFGGYNTSFGGISPWSAGKNPLYIISANVDSPPRHVYSDSASTASALTTGVKTYNGAINVDGSGNQLATVAHLAQQRGFSVGAISSVPVSHATPAASYAHNVSRNDYQDLARDMLGQPSSAHPNGPLKGLDVVIGGGHGVESKSGPAQGSNFIPGNQYVADDDIQAINLKNGGRYVVVQREEGTDGSKSLKRAAAEAASSGKRLFGMYGIGKYKGHLPYQTANGDFQPAPGRTKSAEKYSEADLSENPTLAEMTRAAIEVLATNRKGFWLMVEAGDVDWANHDNNLDNSIGAVLSGDAAVKTVTNWVEEHSNWEESLMIVTADHGHYLVIRQPEALIERN